MSVAPTTLLDSLCQALLSAAKFNRAVQVAPAAVLWPDRDEIWKDVVPTLQGCLPGLLVYGEYAPEHRTGPAIWLKCAIAGLLPEVDLKGQVPIIYLPGVSRADLRAIESCPRELQPLAELQFRGVIWSQENARDWTVNAFLTSERAGLGLTVAEDRASQEALKRALKTGVLLDVPLADLRGREITEEWLDRLLAPNPSRDILVWLNDPQQAEDQWTGARWDIFVSRCKKDFGFDPKADGPLVAAEKLAARKGAWAGVWETYTDSYTSFPRLLEHLDRVSPPARRSFFDDLSAYPQVNADAELTLRHELTVIGTRSESEARAELLRTEESHGERRQWIWARMWRSPLAQALQHLVQVAELSKQPLVGETVDQLAVQYKKGGWQVDAVAMRALAAVQSKADTEAVSSALRAVYLPWLERAALRFQQAVKARGGLNLVAPEPKEIPNGLCLVFVDGLRFDVAEELKQRLNGIGQVALSSAWTSIPSVTASGKAWASPVAHLVGAVSADEHFEPAVAATGKALTAYNFRKLLTDNGFEVIDSDSTGDPAGKAWVEYGDLDGYGHQHGLRLARDLNTHLDQVVERLVELKEAGWARIRIVTDHGWLLVPGEMPKTELALHEAQKGPGRCALLKESADGTPLTFGWDWSKSVQIAMAPGISSFRAGLEYAHGGLSLQECLVPVMDIEVAQNQKSSVAVEITRITWKGMRCSVEVSPALEGLRADIRTRAALAESSVVANVRALEGGKASLAIADDDLIDTAAFVVVLDADGTVLQKYATTIGG